MPFFFSASVTVKNGQGSSRLIRWRGSGLRTKSFPHTHTHTHRHIHTHEGWVNLRQRMIKDYLIAIAKVIDIPSVSDSAALAKRMKCNLRTLRACHVVDKTKSKLYAHIRYGLRTTMHTRLSSACDDFSFIMAQQHFSPPSRAKISTRAKTCNRGLRYFIFTRIPIQIDL
mgnify:CR=1 FL=1